MADDTDALAAVGANAADISPPSTTEAIAIDVRPRPQLPRCRTVCHPFPQLIHHNIRNRRPGFGGRIRCADGLRCQPGSERPSGVVLLQATLQPGCGTAAAPGNVVVTVSGLSPTRASRQVRTINGYRIVSPPYNGAGPRVYGVPALGVVVTITGPAPAAILDSLGPSPRYIVLGAGRAQPVPPTWRTVIYEGVSVAVPPSWPSSAGGDTAPCPGDPFLRPPTVFLGPPSAVRGALCLPTVATTQQSKDSIWLQAGGGPPSNTSPVKTPSGQTVLVTEAELPSPILQIWYHRVSIQLGIGPDPTVARAILDSIRYSTLHTEERDHSNDEDRRGHPIGDQLANPRHLDSYPLRLTKLSRPAPSTDTPRAPGDVRLHLLDEPSGQLRPCGGDGRIGCSGDQGGDDSVGERLDPGRGGVGVEIGPFGDIAQSARPCLSHSAHRFASPSAGTD